LWSGGRAIERKGREEMYREDARCLCMAGPTAPQSLRRRCVRFDAQGSTACSSRCRITAWRTRPQTSQQYPLRSMRFRPRSRAYSRRRRPAILVRWSCSSRTIGAVTFRTLHTRCSDPSLISSLIALDVGIGMPPQRGVLAKVFLALYIPVLAVAYRIGGRVGDAIAQYIAKIAHAPRDPSTVTAKMCWPYYDICRRSTRALMRRWLRPEYPPAGTPFLFLYGRRSPLRYFTNGFTRRVLASHVYSEVQSVEGDHWFPTRSKTRDSVAKTIITWLDKLAPRSSM